MSARRSRRRRKRWAQLAAVLLAAPLGVTVVLVLPWRWIDPGTTSFIVRARAQGYPVRLQWVAWQDLSPHLPIAVIAAEDQGFLHHRGFDVESIRAALREGRRQSRGASTISQQVVKNLYLWPGRSWVRKALEAYLTVFVERLWPKRRILEIYLNIAEFGPGVFGVGAASREYFGKPASHLSAREAALLAAVLPSPKRMSVREPSSYVEQRAEWILRQMRQLGGPSHLQSL